MAKSKSGSKKKKKEGPTEAVAGGGILRSLLRGCATLFLVLVILYVTMLLFVRTDGFRAYLEGQLEKKFGLLVDVGSSRIGWLGDLTLENIVPVSGNGSGGGRVQVKRMVVHTDCLTVWKSNLAATFSDLTVDDCELTFQQVSEGAWEPAGLKSLNQWLNQWCKIDLIDPADELERRGEGAVESEKPSTSQQVLGLVDSFQLNLRRGTVRWEDAEGDLLASVHDLEAYVTPLQIPTRDATHIHVRASSVQLSPSEVIRDLDVELLKSVDTYRVLRLDVERQAVGHAPPSRRPSKQPAVQTEPVEEVVASPREPAIRESRLPPVRKAPEAALEKLIREELHQALDE